MKMKIDLNIEEDVCFYEQTIFSQGSEEADNLENADVQETSAHEAEHLKLVRLDEKFSLSETQSTIPIKLAVGRVLHLIFVISSQTGQRYEADRRLHSCASSDCGDGSKSAGFFFWKQM
ncbi:hypothetical protein MA16_Dca011508 [Dendrobium catenatum]|uniref:Uncharacterized protein n=1 Tax=Dendrobium catenatum TaxID=906689 RepID=A0A2I0VFN9_9ASPA|nr:hypothetical protein MA16_Dca011508 [Dendrobium catenatum]